MRAWYRGSAFSLALAAVCTAVICRFVIWYAGPLVVAQYDNSASQIFKDTFASVFEDVAVIVLIYAAYKIFTFPEITRKRRKILTFVYVVLQLLLVILSVVNALSLVRVGFPISMNWSAYLQQSSVLTLQSSLTSLMSARGYLFVFTAAIVAPAISYFAWNWLSINLPKKPIIALLILLSLPFAFGAWFYPYYLSNWEYRAISPVRTVFHEAFFESENFDDVALITPDDDWEVGKAVSTFTATEDKSYNLVFLVIDSVPAHYLDPEDAKSRLATTPNINELMRDGIFFRNYYTHTPNSAKAQLTMLTSIYPSFGSSFDNKQLDHPKVTPFSTLLQDKGYQTAHFMTGDIRLAGIRDFLEPRGFDYIGESRDFGCEETVPNMLGIYGHLGDRCTTDAMLQWMEKRARPDDPFFVWTWYTNPHHPYYFERKIDTDGANQNEDNFLNALHETDEEIGRLIRSLKERDQYENTIIILTADHGESFGERGQYAHGASVYEEQINIPLIISNPVLFNGSVSDQIGGLVDIPPTVADLLKLPQGSSWQGRSMLDPEKPQRAYFYSLIANVMIGFRDGDKKYVLRGLDGDIVSYDLGKDPLERDPKTISKVEKEQVKDRIASWIEYRRFLFQE